MTYEKIWVSGKLRPVHKSAALLHSIANNHALVDGNKRLGWLATVIFLDLNELSPDL